MSEYLLNPDQALRDAVDVPDGFDIARHAATIAAIGREHSHTISYLALNTEGNCITHALGLTNDDAYREVEIKSGRRLYAGRVFVEWLLRGHLRELSRPEHNALVLYFADTRWVHMGVMSSAWRVRSMWGTFPVYEHGLSEVPARYGDRVRFFEMPKRGEALELFLQFAETAGTQANGASS